MRWKIYYGNNTSYSDLDGVAWNAPALNVQAVVVSDENHGWYVCRAVDYYWYFPEEDRWYCGEIFGLWDYLSSPGQKRVLFGRTIGDKEYQTILDKAMNDPELPPKTGWNIGERRG